MLCIFHTNLQCEGKSKNISQQTYKLGMQSTHLFKMSVMSDKGQYIQHLLLHGANYNARFIINAIQISVNRT
jgi:hypothetical protein